MRPSLIFTVFLLIVWIATLVAPKTFTFQRSKKEESKWQKLKKGLNVKKAMSALKKPVTLPKVIAGAPPPKDSLALAVVPEEAHFDPCATAKTICLSGGTCRNNRGKFHCDCPTTHYGPKCEFVVDLVACSDAWCVNGHCYSTPGEKQDVVKRTKDQELEDAIADYNSCLADTSKTEEKRQRDCNAKLHKTGLSDAVTKFSQSAITVEYKCQCMFGWEGALCDFGVADRYCDEDYCGGHGMATYSGNQSHPHCKCICDPEYTGERCEILLPCADYECFNGGECINHLDSTKNEYTASCSCPTPSLRFVTPISEHKNMISVKGDRCQDYEFNDLVESDAERKISDRVQAYWKPFLFEICNRPKMLINMMEALVDGMKAKGGHYNFYHPRIRIGIASLMDECITPECKNRDKICMHGTCQIAITKLGALDDKEGYFYFPMPQCECEEGFYGAWCDYHRVSVCDPMPDEMAANITAASRCTDYERGECFEDNNGDSKCRCSSGFFGDRCETYSPCAGQPCGDEGECLPIPFEKIKLGEISFRCICALGDQLDASGQCVYKADGACAANPAGNPCFHGKCVNCLDASHPDFDDSVCTDDEMKQGFRCICSPGFGGAYCDSKLGPCSEALCENDSVCTMVGKHGYMCECRPGSSGELCEDLDDPCEFEGNTLCGDTGKCIVNELTAAGFECACKWDYQGIYCDDALSALGAAFKMFQRYYMYTYPAVAVVASLLFGVVAELACGGETASVREAREEHGSNEKAAKGALRQTLVKKGSATTDASSSRAAGVVTPPQVPGAVAPPQAPALA